MMLRILIVIFLGMSVQTIVWGQNIEVANGSFDGEPADATVPQGWMSCKEGTTPDILPGYWGVYTEASDGDTYLGLITRHNNTWEVIGQRLSAPLLKGSCYAWSMDLAHSQTYSGYNSPIRLRVWIGKTKCAKDQLIYESPLIEHSDWRTYKIKFTPEDEYIYILLEAFHSEEEVKWKGNILLDRIGPIQGCDRS